MVIIIEHKSLILIYLIITIITTTVAAKFTITFTIAVRHWQHKIYALNCLILKIHYVICPIFLYYSTFSKYFSKIIIIRDCCLYLSFLL